MDSYSEHPSEFELSAATVSNAAEAVAAAIGTDERRMHVRAYNHWASLLDGRDFPSIEDLEPDNVADFSGHSILLDFTCGGDNPAIPFIGGAIREECGLADDARTIADVPSRSLLSRLTDHYLQIIANRAPIGFEAEFANQRDETICYRGILMPFSSDGETIDFIYGVINWKTVDGAANATAPVAVLVEVAPAPLVAELPPIEAEPAFARDQAAEHVVWEDGPLSEAEDLAVEVALDPDAGLADRLWAARETAEAAKAGEGRTRAALYQALSLAYDFAVAANANPADYAELLEESGVKSQARAPMTPVVKLVFGIDYDKARLTEFAAALSFAQRRDIGFGGFKQLIEQQPGGLKALVAAERAARRPAGHTPDSGEAARIKLRAAPPLALADIVPTQEFSLVLTRIGSDGRVQAVALIEDQALVERAVRHAAS
ncbi:MAG: hypothetical protein ABIS38_06120 [Sphingomicrobium sp.]